MKTTGFLRLERVRFIAFACFGFFLSLSAACAAEIDFTGIFPPSVRTVYIVAPCSHADNATIVTATNELVRCGYKVKVADSVWTYSSDPAVRARALEAAWQDPETDLVLCARGGSGGADTVANLDFDILKSRDIPLVGFSNVSTLLNAFLAKGVKRPITGPLCTTLVNYPNTRESVVRLGDVVGGYSLADSQLTVLRAPGDAVSGKPVGGHWPSINSLADEFLPDTTGRIAFIEINSSYALAAAKTSFDALAARGYFGNLAGLVLCDLGIDGTSAEKTELAEYIRDRVTCPVFRGYPYGHVSKLFAIDFDRALTISTTGLLQWSNNQATRTFDAPANQTLDVAEAISGSTDVKVNTVDGSGTVRLPGENDYVGMTTLGGGTLEASVLAPEYQPSSLGSRGTFQFNAGTFRYTGAEPATFGHAVTIASGSVTVENDADLTLGGAWTATTCTLDKRGTGCLQLVAKNKHSKIRVYEGDLALAGGSTKFTSDLIVGAATGGEADKTRLLVTDGSHETQNIYLGSNTAGAGDHWVDFIMTGGSLKTVNGTSLFLANQNGAHVNMDVSGGTIAIEKNLGVGFQDKTGRAKDVTITIRDSAVVDLGDDASRRTYVWSSNTTTRLTVRDGGTLLMQALCRYNSTATSPTFLVDGGNVWWKAKNDVFKSDLSILNKPVLIGTKGAVFGGKDASVVYRHRVAFAATNTVEGLAAKGVTFTRGKFALEVANDWNGPTLVTDGAEIEVKVPGAVPTDSCVTVRKGATLALTGEDPALAGLLLDGDLHLVQGRLLAVGADGLSGAGCVTLHADAARSAIVTTPGTHPVLTVPIAARAALERFAASASCGNAGSFSVTENGETATLNMLIVEVTDQPDCAAEGTNAASTVTWQCRGAVETVGGVKYLKPGLTARLKAVDATGGLFVGGWRDETTGEFLWGADVAVHPTNHTVYTAVFGPAWNWSGSKLSNGTWTFTAMESPAGSSGLVVTNITTVPSASGTLNFATPVTNASGATFAITALGHSKTEESLFGRAGYSKGKRVGRLYLPAKATDLGYAAFRNCSNLAGRVSMPLGLTTVAPYAFHSCAKITAVDCGDVEELPEYCFAKCKALEEVRLPNTLKSIARHVFNGDGNLVRVIPFLPDAVESVGRSAFYLCEKLGGDLRLLSCKRICYSGFADTAICTAYLPSVTNLGYRAFKAIPTLTNYVFGAGCVGFDDEESSNGWCCQTFYLSDGIERHFTFPGLAPDLRAAGEPSAVGKRMFGASSDQNGKVILHGSWRIDRAGWRQLLDTFGSTDLSGKDLPDLRPDDRRVKGTFNWWNDDDGKNPSIRWGWFVDTAVPGEPVPGGLMMLR